MITNIYKLPFPTLGINEDYYLREHKPQDAKAFFEYYADPIVNQHILAYSPRTLEEAKLEIDYCRNLFYRHEGMYWSIVEKSTEKMIGAIGVYFNNVHHRAEICYDLNKNYWNKGITTLALRVAIDFLFKSGEIFRIEAITMQDNKASLALLKKLGFTYEATLRNYRFHNNRPHDIQLWGLLPPTKIRP